jgi:hypothetical protein
MRKMIAVRLVAAGAMLGSIGFAVALPGAVASAAVKPPVTVTCSSLLGNESQQVQSGCVGSSTKAKVTPYGVSVPGSGDTTATIFWTNKDSTDISISYTTITNTCSTYLDVAASTEVSETSSVTGGNSGLTVGADTSTDVCVYIGTDGTALVVGGSSTLG